MILPLGLFELFGFLFWGGVVGGWRWMTPKIGAGDELGDFFEGGCTIMSNYYIHVHVYLALLTFIGHSIMKYIMPLL